MLVWMCKPLWDHAMQIIDDDVHQRELDRTARDKDAVLLRR